MFKAFALASLLALTSSFKMEEQPMILSIKDECDSKLDSECAGSVAKSVDHCGKAGDDDALNPVADLKCVKNVIGDHNHCMPCVCKKFKEIHVPMPACWF